MSNKKCVIIFILIFFAASSCGKKPTHVSHSKAYQEKGVASWYGWRMKGRKTANGEKYNPKEMTAAHRTLPFNTIVRVTNLDNGRSCKVRINDRGPAKWTHRLIDLSKTAADELGYVGKGTAHVLVEAVK
jgi:rare lipoprotein A